MFNEKHFFESMIYLFHLKELVAKAGYKRGEAYCLIYNVVKINSELKGKQGQQSFQDLS